MSKSTFGWGPKVQSSLPASSQWYCFWRILCWFLETLSGANWSKSPAPPSARKKITLRVLDEITGQIQRYLLVQIFTSILVGVVTWLAFLWIGLEHAAIWGIAAGVFNTVPYLGRSSSPAARRSSPFSNSEQSAWLFWSRASLWSSPGWKVTC